MRAKMRVGNVVKKIDSYWHGNLGEEDESIGELFIIIEVSTSGGSPYGVAKLDDFEDQSWWWDDTQLEFVRDGFDNEYQLFLNFEDNNENKEDDEDDI